MQLFCQLQAPFGIDHSRVISISIILTIDLIVKTQTLSFAGSKIQFFLHSYEFLLFLGRELAPTSYILVQTMKQLILVLQIRILGKCRICHHRHHHHHQEPYYLLHCPLFIIVLTSFYLVMKENNPLRLQKYDFYSSFQYLLS